MTVPIGYFIVFFLSESLRSNRHSWSTFFDETLPQVWSFIRTEAPSANGKNSRWGAAFGNHGHLRVVYANNMIDSLKDEAVDGDAVAALSFGIDDIC